MSLINSIIPIPFIGSRSGVLLQCTDNLDFWQGLYNSDYTQVLDKTDAGNDVEVISNCLQFDGLTSIGEIEDIIVGYVNRVEVLYSIDNVTWETKTEDVFSIDAFKLLIGYANDLYVAGYYSRVKCYADSIQSDPVLEFLMSSGDTTEEDDRSGAVYEDDYTLQSLMNVFNSIPVVSGTDYKYEDSSGFNNDVNIIDSPCGNVVMGEQSKYELPANILDFNQDFDLEIAFNARQDINLLFVNRLQSATGEYFRIVTYRPASDLILEFDIANSTKLFKTIDLNTDYVCKITRRGDEFSLFVDDLLIGSKSRVTTIQTDSIIRFAHENVLGTADSFNSDALYYHFKFNDDVYIPNFAAPYDVSGNGNHLTQSSTDLASLKSGKANIYPYHLFKGFSFDGADVVCALEDESADAQGNAIQYPKGSGIIDGLPNQYVVPEFYPLNLILSAGNYNYAAIDALVESENIEKTKSGSAISNLTIKQDLPNIQLSEIEPETYIHEYTQLS